MQNENNSTKRLLIYCCILVCVLAVGIVFFYFQQEIFPTDKLGDKIPSNVPNTSTGNQSPDSTNQTQKKSSRNDLNGPYYHQIYMATSKDGVTWEKQDKMLFDHTSVPGAVIRDGIIYLYFVDASGEEDQLSVAISKDLGKTFEKKKVKIEGEESENAVDPHPELVNNQIRLYYFGGFYQGGKPSQDDKHKIYSAISDDGINFKNPQFAYQDYEITDPDVFSTDKDWRMLVTKGSSIDLSISTDGGITFKKVDGFVWSKGGVVDTFKFDNTYRTFYCGQKGIESATGAELGNLTMENIISIPTGSFKGICDPSVIQLLDSSYMMFYKVIN